ncbi:hypothetical protein BH09CHL1_BH09CHL1_14880 [soil metagenome]
MSDSGSDGTSALIWNIAVSEQAIAELLPESLRGLLGGYLLEQRWYGEKGQTITGIEIERPDVVAQSDAFIALSVATLHFDSGNEFRYFVPFVLEPGESPDAVARIGADGSVWSLLDPGKNQHFHDWLWNGAIHGEKAGRFTWSIMMNYLVRPDQPASRLLSGEQSNTNIAFGEDLLVKVFRRVQSGLNPDVELGQYLTNKAQLTTVPRVRNDLRLAMPDESEASIAIAQSFIAGSVDGWTWLNERLVEAGEDVDLRSAIQVAIRDLGNATAAIHLALASSIDPEIAPRQITQSDIELWASNTRTAVEEILRRVEERLPSIEHEEARIQAEALVNFGDQLRVSLAGYETLIGLNKTRVHGDYHLGQTLRRGDEWFILDFEGEPARPLSERRARYSPLKDVAGMLRSLGYARAFATQAESAWTDPARTLERVFLAGYRMSIYASPLAGGLIPMGEETFASTLRPWIIDKAIYEIAYELDNRPSWLWVPIMSLFAGDQ